MKHLAIFVVALSTFAATGGTAQSQGDRQAARANFRQADANGDGQLNEAEFRVFIDANADDDLGRAATVRRFGAYNRAFSRVDRDGNGIVTRAELAAANRE